jgi:hypothetical protein
MKEKIVFELRVPRENEYTPEVAASLLSSLARGARTSFLEKLKGRAGVNLALEIACFDQTIHFFTIVPTNQASYLESQLVAAYPLCTLEKQKDYLANFQFSSFNSQWGQLVQSAPYYYPLKTYQDFTDIDPLSSVLGVMSKAKPEEFFLVQFVFAPAGSGWQRGTRKILEKGVVDAEGNREPLPDAKIIEEKIGQVGFGTAVRLVASSEQLLSSLVGSFGAFSRADGNSLKLVKPRVWQKAKFLKSILNRNFAFAPRFQVFNILELATLWHLPSNLIKLPNIAWGKGVFSEPPPNLPVARELTNEEKAEINFLAKTTFKNEVVTFGIKKRDRRRHIYLIGKTGVGKSTLIANMVISDLKKREGVAVIDPHGDLIEILLDYIPSYRINDVVYFNPADKEYPVTLNPLEVENPAQKELVASGIVSIFYKLYHYSWGPRMEHILRNTLLSLVEIPNTTLGDVLKILTNQAFRKKVVDKLTDPVLKNFWTDEFEKMPSSLQAEAVSPILNKVGQFVTSPLIRNIIGKPKSSFNLEEIMNGGRVLLANLSAGKLGEDNSALLGAMLITKIQLAAMSRVNIPEEKRRDFYLYVDEFQNFATTSFIKILSEARKYRLCLLLANQYMAQIDEKVQSAILGNAGTLISFLVGAEDGKILEREFGEKFSESNLVSLSNYQIINKLAVDDLTSNPFFATTLPLSISRNRNREKVIKVSRERYGRRK